MQLAAAVPGSPRPARLLAQRPCLHLPPLQALAEPCWLSPHGHFDQAAHQQLLTALEVTISRVAALEAVLAAGGLGDPLPSSSQQAQPERFSPLLEGVLRAAFERVAACCAALGAALEQPSDKHGSGSVQQGAAAAQVQPEDWPRLQQRMRAAAIASLADYWDRLKSAPKGSHVAALHQVGAEPRT